MGVQELSRLHLLRYSLISGLTLLLCSCQAVTAHSPVGDFDAQVRQLLTNEMLTRAEIANLSNVFVNFQNTLRTRWPGSEVLPLGSFVTGLASKSSDADCMVTVPGHDVTSGGRLVLETAHLLREHPHLYNQIRAKVHPNRRFPLLKFNYIPTQRNCDVNFISYIALKNSQMMHYYFTLNDKFLSLAAILKYWSKVHYLKSTEALASNTLNLLIIFYLQREKVAPPFILLQKHGVRCPVNTWETSFKRIPYNTTNAASLYQLLGGFFKYYSDFNFEEYVVSPLVGRPIPKKDFLNIDNLTDEFFLYKNYVRQPNSKPLTLHTKMCVQDVIEHRRNTADVTDEQVNMFIALVQFAAKMFDVLPSDLFLKVILDRRMHHRNYQLNNILERRINFTDNVNVTVLCDQHNTLLRF